MSTPPIPPYEQDGYHVGYRIGHRDGYAQGYAARDAEEQAAWAHMRDTLRAVTSAPTHAELQRRRAQPGPDPRKGAA